MTDTMELLVELFAGNPDAIGTEEGGAMRIPPDLPFDAQDWWRIQVERHWAGDSQPFGVYPITSFPRHDGTVDQLVRWGCIDYDDGDTSLVNAWNTQRLLDRFAVSSWIEVSRSKGHHLWVFARQWVPVALMRTALLASQQLLGIPPKEVNPKSMALADGQLGNYVRLPYPGALVERPEQQLRRVVVGVAPHGCDENEPWVMGAYSVHNFANLAHAQRVPAHALETLAARYKPEPAPARLDGLGALSRDAIDQALDRTIPYLNGYAYVIWRDGPTEGSDRSTTLMRLAHRAAANVPPIPPQDCLALVADLDSRLGKFTDRADGPEQLQKIVARAYAHAGGHNPTGDTE